VNSRILTADYADSADVLRKETSSIRLIREIRGQPLFQEFLTADYADSADVLRKETSSIRLIREISGQSSSS